MNGEERLAGRYHLGRVLGAGGMGRVHAAWDGLLSREVALKLLREEDARDPELLERFRREARSAGSLSHSNTVRVFDAGYAEGPRGPFPYIAMELVRGSTLKERLRRVGGPLPPREAATLALQVAGALGEAHGLGIVHRDVKPENVLLGELGQAKVADFGIARAAEAATMTRTGWALGTAAYVSPEQAVGEPSGPSADLYSLGVVLYEMLVGNPPFSPDDTDLAPLAVAMRHLREAPVPPRRREPSVPPRLERITLALLEKRPEDRYESAQALASDLERFLDGEEPLLVRPAAAPIPSPTSEGLGNRRSRARVRRGRLAAALAFVLVASAAFAAATGFLAVEGGAWPPSVPHALRRVAGAGQPARVSRVIEPYPVSQLDGRPAVDLSGSGGSRVALAAAKRSEKPPGAGGDGERPTPETTTGATAATREDQQQLPSGSGLVESADTQTLQESPQEQTVLRAETLEQTFAEDPPAEAGLISSPREPGPTTEP